MGLTGVIYAIIVAAWAFFLVPLALRRNDRTAREHSIERFSSAMRVLSRRDVAAPAADDRLVTPTLRRDDAPAAVAPAPRPSRAAMAAAAARRRRVLSVLLGLTLAVAAVAAFGVLPLWSVAAPVVLVFSFLFVARRQVRLADERFWREVADARPEPTNVVRRDAVRVDASHGAVRDPDEPTVDIDVSQLRAEVLATDERVDVVSVQTADGGSLWDPVPVTLPTYVDKTVAQRSVRTIDLGEPGTWSAGHSAADSAAARNADAAASSADAADAADAAEQTA